LIYISAILFLLPPVWWDEKPEIESGYFVSLWLFLGHGRSLFVQGKGKRGSFWGFLLLSFGRNWKVSRSLSLGLVHRLSIVYNLMVL